ncbi:putative ATPase subunit of terminase (gpP-like) [Halomonas elongata]|uniref:Putative ATPase subunit of terminase (GpP-like) n=1 Tax=Halomonas elongata TaxID=2746 RepID=A0A1B8P0B4_HALEL|nr:putative ATPase subunit of terminase (gpP-like) [Halomonas elongata]
MTTPLPDTPDSPRLTARHLYWQGWRVVRIAEFLDIKTPTVHSWKERDGWATASPTERVEGALELDWCS